MLEGKNVAVTRFAFMGAILSAIGGAYVMDGTWIISSAFAALVLWLPRKFSRNRKGHFDPNVIVTAPVISVVFFVLALVFREEMGLFQDLWDLSLILEAAMLMPYCLGLMLVMAKVGKSTVGNRWIILYTVLIPSTIAVFYSMYLYGAMAYMGIPLSNTTVAAMGSAARTALNWDFTRLMTMFFIVSIVAGVAIKRLLPHDSESLIREGGDDDA